MLPAARAPKENTALPRSNHPTAETAARLLRSVALDLARRVNHRLPGIAGACTRRTVVRADGDHVVGVLGSHQAPAWRAGNERFDKLTIALRHAAHQATDPAVYAENIFTTLAHEMAHAYTQMSGLVGTSGPGRAKHTEDFALVAVRLGLRVVRRPEHPTAIFTPGISVYGRIEFADLIDRIAAGSLARTSGIGYAGPQRFHDLIAQAPGDVLGTAAASTPAASSGAPSSSTSSFRP